MGLVEPDRAGRFDLTHWVAPTGGPRGVFVFSQTNKNAETLNNNRKLIKALKKIIKNMKIDQHKNLYNNKIQKRVFEDN